MSRSSPSLSSKSHSSVLKKPLASLALMGAIAGLAACGGSSDDDNTGRLSLSVTDAPVDSATEVVVAFTGVSIKPAGGEAVEFVFDEVKSINLLDLQGTASESLLDGETVAAGEYQWIRLDVAAQQGVMDSYIGMNDGSQLELTIPSGSETGLKLVSGFTVPVGGDADFTIDFDLRKSITNPRDATSAILRPALRIVDNTVVGSIAGMVDGSLISTCADSSVDSGAVYVYSGADATPADVQGAESDPLASALVSVGDGGEYQYEVGFLSEGSYTLAYTCDAGQDDPATADVLNFAGTANAEVTANTETVLNLVAAEQS